ncbi:NDP-hexose 2,3-dehydratase family protein [Pelagibacterales bacterium SAG-MED06]|nr:NDP-hexose 2,3-dehydratase family protein [Pelagibacterales bacterium SAG-MED06]
MNISYKISSKINKIKKNIYFKKKQIKLKDAKYWEFEDAISHKSNKFFQIYGYYINKNFPKIKKFYQPLISQKEIGYLVIFQAKLKNKNFFLLQLKAEPGNKNIIQLSPTIQATKSNYTRVHGGKKTKYLKYTYKKENFLLNINQPEQGSKYLNKFNKNMIIKTNKIKNLPENFIWIEKNELVKLSNINNLLNMDTLSVLSCYLKKNNIDKPINTLKKINDKYLNFKEKYFIKLKKVPLTKMKNWTYDNYKYFDKKNVFFKINAFKIKTDLREISHWSQPLISDYNHGLNVLFVKKNRGTLNYLCQLVQEVGYDIPHFTSTIMLKNCIHKNNDLIKSFIKKNNIKINKKVIDVNNSDEGGRFNNNQTKNIVYEINGSINKLEKLNYIWISYNQMIELLKKKLLTIELRNLFGVLNLNELK